MDKFSYLQELYFFYHLYPKNYPEYRELMVCEVMRVAPKNLLVYLTRCLTGLSYIEILSLIFKLKIETEVLDLM